MSAAAVVKSVLTEMCGDADLRASCRTELEGPAGTLVGRAGQYSMMKQHALDQEAVKQGPIWLLPIYQLIEKQL